MSTRDRLALLPSFLAAAAPISGALAQITESRAGQARARVERRVRLMGTTLSVRVRAQSRARGLAASEAAIAACEAVERRLSTWTESSELARFNRGPAGTRQQLSAALAEDLRAARSWSMATEGAFDPGIGALIDAWKLRTGGAVPSPATITRARRSGFSGALSLEGDVAVRGHERLRIEEGGFGKGRALDAALARLRAHAVSEAVLDLGGQIARFGPGEARFAIADPRDRGRRACSLRIDSGSLATSGNSERGIVVGGKRYGHVLDPRTGRPAAEFGSLTVWARDATAADCLSTGLYVLGPKAAVDWAERRDGIEVVALVVRGERLHVRCTRGVAGRLDVEAGVARPDAGAATRTKARRER